MILYESVSKIDGPCQMQGCIPGEGNAHFDIELAT